VTTVRVGATTKSVMSVRVGAVPTKGEDTDDGVGLSLTRRRFTLQFDGGLS